jgi:hypothetical protein
MSNPTLVPSQAEQTDATPAYRGYRLQALYTLARVLERVDGGNLIYQPEGREDLAVFSAEQVLLEIIQVKQRSQNLALSSFEPEKKDSFFNRVAAELKTSPDARILIVAFGNVGPELEKAIEEDGPDRARVAGKIAKHNHLSEAEATLLFEKIQLVLVDEDDLRSRVYAALESSLAGVDPDSAFELLSNWLYLCAENKTKITPGDVIERINAVGRFAASRATHHKEWFTSIVPLEDKATGETLEPDELSDEFYRGISTRYEHILADLDVVRPHKLREIAARFDDKRVVIVHAASGQGKTTLAYRYLHEYFPREWRFRIRSVASREHALSVALALTAHADAVGVPLAVYLDVSPQDRDWPELVKQLSAHRNIRILVTVREEDWRRASVSVTEFEFEAVELSFDRTEAGAIYESLVRKRTPANILDFEEAWHKFGEAGPLMEFIYLVTQGDSLRQRLSQQVAHLENEAREGRMDAAEIELLRLTSIASASEARLKLKPLVEQLRLRAPQSTLRLFEKEYLLRVSDDGSRVQGLHPIRSTILTGLLTDPALASWADGASSCLPFVDEEDVENFLLHAFSRHRGEHEKLLRSVESYQPNGWNGIAGVTRALIWLGVTDYVEANFGLIEEAVTEYGNGGWSFFLDFDVADVSGGTASSWWKDLDLEVFTDEVKQKLEALQSRQTDKRQVFERVARWLVGRTGSPVHPVTEADWSGAAEVVFWVGRLSTGWPLRDWLPEADLDKAIDLLSLETLADLASGVFESGAYPDWLAANRQRLIDRFRRDTHTVMLEDDGHKLTARFIFPLPEADDAPAEDPQKMKSTAGNAFHDEAVQRLGLLRRLIPDREEFASQGYGHMLWDNFLEFDETIKTGIERKHLPLMWLTLVNSAFRGVADLRFRPSTWAEYAQQVHRIRWAVVDSLKQLERGIQVHFRRRHASKILGAEVDAESWDACKKMLNNPPRLPQVAVDEWGFVEESTSDANARSAKERLTKRSGLAVQKYKPFLKSFNEYTRTLSNFFTQAVDGMTLNPYLGRTTDRRKVLEAAATLGVKPGSAKLATLNLADTLKNLIGFQHESRKILGPFFEGRELNRLDGEEQKIFRRVWNMWYFFAFHPERVMQDAVEACARESQGILRNIRLDLRVRLRRISSDDLRFGIASEEILWDERPALWLIADARHPLAALGSLPNLLAEIRQAVRKVKNNDLRRYILDMHWPHVVIVPLVRGKYANAAAWRISLPVIIENDGSELSWWNYAQHQIPPDALDQLKIESWDLPQLTVAVKLMQSTSVLFQIAAHIRDFRRLPDLDQEGVAQLQAYVDRISKYSNEALQSVFEAESEMLAIYNNLSETERKLRPALLESALALAELHDSIMPASDFEHNAAINLEGLVEWASRLEQAPPLALAASSSWMSDILDQEGV